MALQKIVLVKVKKGNLSFPVHSSDDGVVQSPNQGGKTLPLGLDSQSARRGEGNMTNLAMIPFAPVSSFSLCSWISMTVYNEIFTSFIFSHLEQIPKQRRVLKVLIKLIAMNTGALRLCENQMSRFFFVFHGCAYVFSVTVVSN